MLCRSGYVVMPGPYPFDLPHNSHAECLSCHGTKLIIRCTQQPRVERLFFICYAQAMHDYDQSTSKAHWAKTNQTLLVVRRTVPHPVCTSEGVVNLTTLFMSPTTW
jgi:hypothetical protein